MITAKNITQAQVGFGYYCHEYHQPTRCTLSTYLNPPFKTVIIPPDSTAVLTLLIPTVNKVLTTNPPVVATHEQMILCNELGIKKIAQ